MSNIEDTVKSTFGDLVKSTFGEKIGGDMINEIKNGINKGLAENQILNNLFRLIEPNLTDEKIKKVRDLFRFRAVVTQGQPPPPLK